MSQPLQTLVQINTLF